MNFPVDLSEDPTEGISTVEKWVCFHPDAQECVGVELNQIRKQRLKYHASF